MASSDSTISVVLISEGKQETGTTKVPSLMYYLPRALQGAEARYPPIEKLALAVVAIACRLCPYFQANVIIIPMGYPILQALK